MTSRWTPDERHWTVKDFRERITREALRLAILESRDYITRDGYIQRLRKRSLGFGVYEVWFEREGKEGGNGY